MGSPTDWLARNKFTPINAAKWTTCKFGMLCKRCNGYFPTKGRKELLKNIRIYILGK
jgi:hypothetical protein